MSVRPACLVVLCAAAFAFAGAADRTREKIAAGWVSLAEWCDRKRMAAEGEAAVKEALAVAPDFADAKRLAGKIAGGGEVPESVREQYAKEAARVAKRLVPLYLALAADEDAGDAARRDSLLLTARKLGPDEAGAPFGRAWAAAVKASDWPRVVRLLSGVPVAERTPEMAEAFARAELAASATEPVERTCRSHPMKYWLSLPPGWDPAREWPILVTADGAGRNWKGSAQNFMRERDKAKAPFIVVSVFRLNENDYPADLVAKELRPAGPDEWFDLVGVTAVAAEVAAEFHGRAKFFMTGFSAGGAVTWYLTIYHPERLLASAPACGGFGMRSAPGEKLATEAPERETLPIRVFQGVDDKLALGPLAGDEAKLREGWRVYADSFERQGFGNVELVLLPGVGHSPCAGQVVAFFGEVLAAK